MTSKQVLSDTEAKIGALSQSAKDAYIKAIMATNPKKGVDVQDLIVEDIKNMMRKKGMLKDDVESITVDNVSCNENTVSFSMSISYGIQIKPANDPN